MYCIFKLEYENFIGGGESYRPQIISSVLGNTSWMMINRLCATNFVFLLCLLSNRGFWTFLATIRNLCSVEIQFHGIQQQWQSQFQKFPVPFLLPLTVVLLHSKPDCWKDSFFEGRGGIMISSQWSGLWRGTKAVIALLYFLSRRKLTTW